MDILELGAIGETGGHHRRRWLVALCRAADLAKHLDNASGFPSPNRGFVQWDQYRDRARRGARRVLKKIESRSNLAGDECQRRRRLRCTSLILARRFAAMLGL